MPTGRTAAVRPVGMPGRGAGCRPAYGAVTPSLGDGRTPFAGASGPGPGPRANTGTNRHRPGGGQTRHPRGLPKSDRVDRVGLEPPTYGLKATPARVSPARKVPLRLHRRRWSARCCRSPAPRAADAGQQRSRRPLDHLEHGVGHRPESRARRRSAQNQRICRSESYLWDCRGDSSG